MDATTGHDDRRALADRMIRRQSRLSLRLAAVFVTALVLLPLVNLLLPDLAGARIGGFTLSWLLLAVLFYPFTVLLSAIFVRGSDRIESEIVRGERGTGNGEPAMGSRDPGEPSRSPSPVPGSPTEQREDPS